MFLRHSTVRKDGKTHTYWRLVRSVRRGGKVAQETIAQLGELDGEGRLRARGLARWITGRNTEQAELFEEQPNSGQRVAVQLNRVRLERQRGFGDVWLAWTLWRSLGLDTACQELMAPCRGEVPWSVMSAVLVIARLCEPSTAERHTRELRLRCVVRPDRSQAALLDRLGLRLPDRLRQHTPAV